MITFSSPKGLSTSFYPTIKEGKNGTQQGDESLGGAETEEE